MARTVDMVIKGGVLVNGKEMRKADVYIKDGLVDSIEQEKGETVGRQVVDAAGKFVLPGIIDAHCHPVYADRIDTLSQSAAHGGITTLIPYIGAVKAWGKTGGLLDAVKDFIEEGQKTSAVDFGIHCTLVHDDIETVASVIPKLVDLGVISFKGFMAFSKRGMKLEDNELMKVMETIAGSGALLGVHAENGTIIDYLEDKFAGQGNLGPEFYHPSHPNLVEAEAVFRILTLAQIMKCPLYLPHLSARESLEVVRLFKKWGGLKLRTETCTHYLTLTDAEMKKRGSLAKVGPPLRETKDIEEMWRAVSDGTIDVIGSDAAGLLMKSKEPIRENIFKAASGFPGVETMFTVAYDEGINKGRLTLPQLVKLTCENPAKIFGLYPKKGILQKGSDADVVIFDPALSYTVKAESQHLKCDYTMYDGRKCLGSPVLVLQRGKVLVENGELKAEAGLGKYLAGKPGLGD